MSVLGKVYGTVLTKKLERVLRGYCDEPDGSTRGKGSMDSIIAVKQVCEKYLAKSKDVFWAFMDSEKYVTLDREVI